MLYIYICMFRLYYSKLFTVNIFLFLLFFFYIIYLFLFFRNLFVDETTFLNIYSLVNFFCIIIFTIMIDRVGYQFFWMICGCTSVTLSILCLNWINVIPDIIPLLFLALGNSVAVIPGISVFAYILKKSWWGRAFSTSIFALALGRTVSTLNTIFISSEYFALTSAITLSISLVLMFIINLIDYRYGRIINRHRNYWKDVIWNNPHL